MREYPFRGSCHDLNVIHLLNWTFAPFATTLETPRGSGKHKPRRMLNPPETLDPGSGPAAGPIAGPWRRDHASERRSPNRGVSRRAGNFECSKPDLLSELHPSPASQKKAADRSACTQHPPLSELPVLGASSAVSRALFALKRECQCWLR